MISTWFIETTKINVLWLNQKFPKNILPLRCISLWLCSPRSYPPQTLLIITKIITKLPNPLIHNLWPDITIQVSFPFRRIDLYAASAMAKMCGGLSKISLPGSKHLSTLRVFRERETPRQKCRVRMSWQVLIMRIARGCIIPWSYRHLINM